MIYPNSITALENDLSEAPLTPATALAQRLVHGAKAFDLLKAERLDVNFRYKGVVRDAKNPPSYTTEEVAIASWADPMTFPLSQGQETWNEGRRATASNTAYEVVYALASEDLTPEEYQELPDYKKNAYPINPYMNTGLNGRGCLGQYGPNHAVDNGILVMKADEEGNPALYALGILRKFDNDAPAFSGGFAKYKKDDRGCYVFDRDSVIESQMEELFEEMISGSIELLPEYRDQLPLALAMEVQNRALSVKNPRSPHKLLTEDAIRHLQVEIETGLKLQQVRDKDPGFIERLRALVAKGHECFSGPVLNDNRNTNNAWIETRLSWFLLDDQTWADIKGETPVFDYAFSSGDDASGVVYHKLDADLIQKAYASHGPMFAFMAASFLLHAQKYGFKLDPQIYQQLENIADFLHPQVPKTQNNFEM